MVNDINPFNNQGRTDTRSVKGIDAAPRSQTLLTTDADYQTQTSESSINISDLAKRMAEFEQIASASADVDQAKVEALSSQVQNNTYVIDAENLAQKLLQADN